MIKRTITILVLLAACLIGVCMAEPQPVDGGWHRSDEVPAETPTAAPTDGEQHSADEEQAPSRVDADAAVTTAAEPQPRDVVMEPEVAEQRFDVGLSPWNTLSEDEQMWVVVTAVVAGLFLIGVLYLFTMIGRVAKEGNCEWKPKR